MGAEGDLNAGLENLCPEREMFWFLFFVLSKVVVSLKCSFWRINLVVVSKIKTKQTRLLQVDKLDSSCGENHFGEREYFLLVFFP